MGGYFTAQGLQTTADSSRSVGVGPFVITCSDETFMVTCMPPAGISQIGNPPNSYGLWVIPDPTNNSMITMVSQYTDLSNNIAYAPAFQISKTTPTFFAFPTNDNQTPTAPTPIMYFSASTAFSTPLTFQWV